MATNAASDAPIPHHDDRVRDQREDAAQAGLHAGCDILRIEPSYDLGYHRGFKPPWFAVGHFDGERVFVDKQGPPRPGRQRPSA